MAGLFPLPKYFFKVDFMGNSNPISFKEIKGLSQEFEMVEYREGNSGPINTRKRIGMVKSSAVTFTKGIFTNDKKLTNVITKNYWTDLLYGSSDDEAKTTTIHLCDEKGNNKITWVLSDCVPIKLDFGDLSSESSDIMIEEMQLNYGLMEVTFN